MDMENFLVSGRKIILFAGQLVILFFCIWYIEFIYYTNIYPDKLVKETYEQTNCIVVNKTLSSKGHLLSSFRADFLVSYTAAGVQYREWISGNGLDRSFTTDRASQESVLDQFDVNATYPCWYNPETPQLIVIALRHNWASTFPLFIPSVIAFIMIYYLARTLFEFLGENAIKLRKNNK